MAPPPPLTSLAPRVPAPALILCLQMHRPLPRRKYSLEGYPLHGMLGFLEWVFLALFTTTLFVLQYVSIPCPFSLQTCWTFYAFAYIGLDVAHVIVTTRYGTGQGRCRRCPPGMGRARKVT